MPTKDKIVFIASAAMMAAGNFRTECGVTFGCPWWHHLTFHFVHGNIFHFAINILVLWMYCQNVSPKVSQWLTAFTAATAASFIAPTQTPLVGFSGILMFMYGTLLPKIWSSKKVRLTTCAFIAISIASLWFNQAAAVLFHAITTMTGVAYTKTKDLIYDIKDQEERTHRRRTGG